MFVIIDIREGWGDGKAKQPGYDIGHRIIVP